MAKSSLKNDTASKWSTKTEIFLSENSKFILIKGTLEEIKQYLSKENLENINNVDKITAIFDEYKNDVGSEHVYTNEDFINIANRIRDAKGEAYEGYQEYLQFLENLGINLDDIADTSTLTGSIQNLTEETGGIIAGRLNAMVINQAEGNNFLRQSLLVQYDMRNYLGQIQVDVASIKANVGVVGVRFNENMNYGYAEQTSY